MCGDLCVLHRGSEGCMDLVVLFPCTLLFWSVLGVGRFPSSGKKGEGVGGKRNSAI